MRLSPCSAWGVLRTRPFGDRDHHVLRPFSRNEVATVAGMAGTFGNAGLFIFSLLIGALVATVGYTPFFICLGLLDLLGAAICGRWSANAKRKQSEDARAFHAHSKSDPAWVQSGSLHHSRRRRLLHSHVHVRVVPRSTDTPFARSYSLTFAIASAEPPQPTGHARRPRFLWCLGAVPHLCRRPLLAGLHGRETVRPHHPGRPGRRLSGIRTTIS